ncbi:heavy-metal-associated domain-containing protein [Lichenihabitans psoromatis]|uniref:heavy-metal-associated domain-containing protein n=1 Tax=Lichenihabitans psoromatis TaxID=2528642 RepID=UPI00103842A2|nr:heavy-metal-associated domain-containing protein [Lichenihabitans psoromatis]
MLTLNVPDMSCDHCVSTIERAVKATDSAAVVVVDLSSHIVSIETDRPPADITAAIEAVGYTVASPAGH